LVKKNVDADASAKTGKRDVPKSLCWKKAVASLPISPLEGEMSAQPTEGGEHVPRNDKILAFKSAFLSTATLPELHLTAGGQAVTFMYQPIGFSPLCRFATSPPQGGRSDPHWLLVKKNVDANASAKTGNGDVPKAPCWEKAVASLPISPLEGEMSALPTEGGEHVPRNGRVSAFKSAFLSTATLPALQLTVGGQNER
jgi:hypothetical protein